MLSPSAPSPGLATRNRHSAEASALSERPRTYDVCDKGRSAVQVVRAPLPYRSFPAPGNTAFYRVVIRNPEKSSESSSGSSARQQLQRDRLQCWFTSAERDLM